MPNLTPADLDKIEAAAREATPGEWETWAAMVYVAGENGANICAASEPRATTTVEYTPPKLSSPDLNEAYANARHIATSNPAAVLRLVEAYREREAEITDLKKKLAACENSEVMNGKFLYQIDLIREHFTEDWQIVGNGQWRLRAISESIKAMHKAYREAVDADDKVYPDEAAPQPEGEA